MPLKRDHWANEEVIAILNGMRYEEGARFAQTTNATIDDLVDTFRDFTRSRDDHAAMAFDTDKMEIVHIGPILPK